MFEILQGLSDDQTAILGCGLALTGALLLLMFSYHSNPNNRPGTQEMRVHQRKEPTETTADNQRRAA